MTLHQLAAPAATSLQVGQQLLGTVGTGGAALISTTILILGVRGKAGIKLSKLSSFVTGYVAGTMYTACASFWTAPATITNGVAGAIVGTDGPLGDVGLGALASVVAAVAYGADLSKGKKAVLGIAAATVWSEAGGIWATGRLIVTGVLGHFLGVA